MKVYVVLENHSDCCTYNAYNLRAIYTTEEQAELHCTDMNLRILEANNGVEKTFGDSIYDYHNFEWEEWDLEETFVSAKHKLEL